MNEGVNPHFTHYEMKKFCPAAFSAHNRCNFKLPWWLSPVDAPLLLMAKPGYRVLINQNQNLSKNNIKATNFATAVSMIELEGE